MLLKCDFIRQGMSIFGMIGRLYRYPGRPVRTLGAPAPRPGILQLIASRTICRDALDAKRPSIDNDNLYLKHAYLCSKHYLF